MRQIKWPGFGNCDRVEMTQNNWNQSLETAESARKMAGLTKRKLKTREAGGRRIKKDLSRRKRRKEGEGEEACKAKEGMIYSTKRVEMKMKGNTRKFRGATRKILMVKKKGKKKVKWEKSEELWNLPCQFLGAWGKQRLAMRHVGWRLISTAFQLSQVPAVPSIP